MIVKYVLLIMALVVLMIGASNELFYGDVHHVPNGMTPKQYATDLMLLVFVVIPFALFIINGFQQNEVEEKERNKTRYNNLSQEERVESIRQAAQELRK